MKQEQKWIIIFGLIIVIGSFLVSMATHLGPINQSEDDYIEVSGSASSEHKPEVFSLTIGIEESSTNVAEAEKQVRAQINTLIEELGALGLGEDEIKSHDFRIRQDYSRTVAEPMPPEKEDAQKYIISQRISIESEELELVPALLDTAVNSGANIVQGLQFELTKETEDQIKQELLSKALENAKGKADAVVSSTDQKIGKAQQIQIRDHRFIPYKMDSVEESSLSEQDLPRILEGRIEQTASVDVRFKLH